MSLESSESRYELGLELGGEMEVVYDRIGGGFDEGVNHYFLWG